MKSYITKLPEETEAFGREFAQTLKKGDKVVLSGDLGGGKTCFTRGVVSKFAPQSSDIVCSPTFSIMNVYHGDIDIYHFDFYRLPAQFDVEESGFLDYLEGDGIALIEWGEKLNSEILTDALRLNFEYIDEVSRKITVS